MTELKENNNDVDSVIADAVVECGPSKVAVELEKAPTITIKVHVGRTKLFPLILSLDDTVGHMKSLIETESDVPVMLQKLVYKGLIDLIITNRYSLIQDHYFPCSRRPTARREDDIT